MITPIPPALRRARARAALRPSGPGTDHSPALAREGWSLQPRALPGFQCARLHHECERQRRSSAPAPRSRIHSRGRRQDLALRITAPIADALVSLTRELAPTLRGVLCNAPLLAELSYLHTPPGSACQPPHPDQVPDHGAHAPQLLTVFVPLVDVAMEGGPLELWPGSHVDPVPTRPARCLPVPQGTAILMDARTVHRGTANRSSRARPVLYISWRRRGARPEGPTWSLHPSVPSSIPAASLLAG